MATGVQSPVYTNDIQRSRVGVKKMDNGIYLRVDNETMEALELLKGLPKNSKKNKSDLIREAIREKAARESAESQDTDSNNRVSTA